MQNINKYGANVSPCKTPVTISKKSVSPGERTIAFVFSKSIIIQVRVYLERLYASSISSIFPLCIELNTLDKSTNGGITSTFFTLSLSMIWRIVRICEAVKRIFRKLFWVWRKNFHNFGSDTVEKQGIINLSGYSCKNYAYVILSNSEIAYFRERGGGNLSSISILCFAYRQRCIIREVWR